MKMDKFLTNYGDLKATKKRTVTEEERSKKKKEYEKKRSRYFKTDWQEGRNWLYIDSMQTKMMV